MPGGYWWTWLRGERGLVYVAVRSALTGFPVAKPAVGCVRQDRDSRAGSVSYSCMDYRFYHSDGSRRVQPVDVDVPAPAVPGAVMQSTTAIKTTPGRGGVDSPVERCSGAPMCMRLIRLSPKPKPRVSVSIASESKPPQYQVELLGDDFMVYLHEGPERPTHIDLREKAVQRPSHECLHRGWEHLLRNCMAPYVALLEEWHRDGSNAIQLGLEPDRDSLSGSCMDVEGVWLSWRSSWKGMSLASHRIHSRR